ncbi:MAG: WYL domain-containing protein [Austwickia sp.]|nr:WYL domain-containing protein [Austwickia sp.]
MSATGRRLTALALLQAHPGITAERLAIRLGVTERTVRRDVAHLRDLGYRVDAEPGRYGGYTLASGSAMPPLLLDAEEALAVALGLRTAVGVEGLEPAAVTALAKLTETVPSRLRARLQAVAATETVSRSDERATDAGTLATLALACRAGEAVRFRHGDRARDAQPHRLVRAAERWYLVACERGTDRWLTYAVDRVSDARPLGIHLPAPPPPENAASFVTEALAHGPWRYRVRVRIHTSADLVQQLVDPTVGTISAEDEDCCLLTMGTDDLDWAARWLIYRNLDFDVLEPPELTRHIHDLGLWLTHCHPLAP